MIEAEALLNNAIFGSDIHVFFTEIEFQMEQFSCQKTNLHMTSENDGHFCLSSGVWLFDVHLLILPNIDKADHEYMLRLYSKCTWFTSGCVATLVACPAQFTNCFTITTLFYQAWCMLPKFNLRKTYRNELIYRIRHRRYKKGSKFFRIWMLLSMKTNRNLAE